MVVIRFMDAFKVKVGRKVLDYRVGEALDLEEVKKYFAKEYTVKKIWRGGRHVLGILKKEERELFLKLSTTEGISVLTNVEGEWNKQFNELSTREIVAFWVPKNYASGYFQEKLFYLITDVFEGALLADRPDRKAISPVLQESVDEVIHLSEYIQMLPLHDLQREGYIEATNYKEWFVEKTKSWYRAIPEQAIEDYGVEKLLQIVEDGVAQLDKKPRHGDFTPWHIMKLQNGKLGLLDGEHAMSDGVEYYDIGYFIQRVFSVLELKTFAKAILEKLLTRNYDVQKLQVILAARGIGGFLDRSLHPTPDYTIDGDFKDWVLGLSAR